MESSAADEPLTVDLERSSPEEGGGEATAAARDLEAEAGAVAKGYALEARLRSAAAQAESLAGDATRLINRGAAGSRFASVYVCILACCCTARAPHSFCVTLRHHCSCVCHLISPRTFDSRRRPFSRLRSLRYRRLTLQKPLTATSEIGVALQQKLKDFKGWQQARSKDDNRFSVVDRLPRSQRDAASALLKQITAQLDATEAAQAKRDASRPASSRAGTAARAAAAKEAAKEAAKQDAAAACHAELLAEQLRKVAASTKEAEAEAQAQADADAIAAAAQSDVDSGAGRARSRPSSKVSVLLCTVTYYANRAHNLTRSP